MAKEDEERGAKGRWVPRQVSLNFTLGNFNFFSTSFSAMEFVVHFSQLSCDPADPPPPAEGFFSRFEAALISTHPVTERLPALKLYPRVIRYVPTQYTRYSIDLRGTFEDYLKKFSAKSRKTLTQELRKYTEYCGGILPWREYRGTNDLKEFYRQACEVSKNSWQAQHWKAGFPTGDEFWAEMSELAARDAIRGYILFHQQRPVAYAYCDVEDGVLVYGIVGYDLEYERWSPGTILLYLIIQKQFRDQVFPLFDFGGHDDWYKGFFSTRSTLCADILYFRRDTRTFLLLFLHSGLIRFKRSVGKVLGGLGLKAYVRKLLRRKIPVRGRARPRNGLSF